MNTEAIIEFAKNVWNTVLGFKEALMELIRSASIALAVVAGLGLILGILLALCIRFFHVEEDEKKQKIRECLPGVNCGACGYSGCDGYAEAIANGGAKANLCTPGAESTAKALGELLGIAVEEPADRVAFVRCNGTCEVVSNKANYDGINTCKARAMLYGGPKTCSYCCLGCGDCAEVCGFGAICMDSGIARIDTSRCVGCGMCTRSCPKSLIIMVPQETAVAVYCNNKNKGAEARKICASACIGCKKCEKTCPVGAISVVNNCAVVDYSVCTGCGACADGCPTGCLKKVSFPDLPESED